MFILINKYLFLGDNMTDREKEILDILKTNPMISQKELADILCITRSSVAVHITNLMKKGYIKGKGYILKKDNYITVIGGSNIDIVGIPTNPLIMYDSTPGKVNISVGGAGRNIAENICRLGINTKLISAIGNDLYGNTILDECKNYGIDVDDCYISNEESTSIYVSVLNNSNDIKVAISHMDIIDKLDIPFINSKHLSISDSLAIIIDTNLPEDTIDFITKTYTSIPIFVDIVSSSKCLKVKNFLGRFEAINLSQKEAELLSGIKISDENDLNRCLKYFLDQGIKRVFINLDKNNIFSSDGKNIIHIKDLNIDTVSVTGARDAFMSGIVYSYLNKFNLKYSTELSVAASILTLSHKSAVNPNLSIESIEKTLKELISC